MKTTRDEWDNKYARYNRQRISDTIYAILWDRYKQLLDRKMGGMDEGRQLNAMVLIETNRQKLCNLSAYSRMPTVYETKQLRWNESNHDAINSMWIKVAKSPVFDGDRCVLFPLLGPMGTWIFPNGDSRRVSIMSRLLAKVPDEKMDAGGMSKRMLEIVQTARDDNPCNTIVFCPYMLMIDEYKEDTWAVLRYGIAT